MKDKIIFSLEFKWIKSSNGEKVTGAIQGGCKHGEMYIGRAFHVSDLIPGKFPCSHDVLYLPWGGKEYYKKEYEILVSDEKARYGWVPSSNGQVPQEAIPGKGPFNNYVDKMRGRGEGVKKWQNSVHIVVECPLKNFVQPFVLHLSWVLQYQT